MTTLNRISASMRIMNDDKKRICSVLGMAHDVEAATVGNFVDAIETLYNNGACTARMNIALEVVR